MESSNCGAMNNLLVSESPKSQKRTLEEIESDPLPVEPRVLRMKRSDIEQWRQIITNAKKRLIGSVNSFDQ